MHSRRGGWNDAAFLMVRDLWQFQPHVQGCPSGISVRTLFHVASGAMTPGKLQAPRQLSMLLPVLARFPQLGTQLASNCYALCYGCFRLALRLPLLIEGSQV